MKRRLFPVVLTAACLFAVSCEKDNENITKDDENEGSSITRDTIDFSDLTLEANSYWNNNDSSGEFTSGKAVFLNRHTYDASYNMWSWGGFAYSNQNDTLGSGYNTQFNVYTATPNAHGIFALGYVDTYTPAIPTITFDEQVALKSADFALNTYAYKSMRDGENGWGESVIAKKFAAGDWYKITIKNINSSNVASDSLEVYLADFREGKSILIDDWTEFSFDSFAASKVTFEASSSDVGAYGMNTPAYFCIDNIVIETPKKEE
ncbi:MAG: DUF4465 domain-containing protein [Prevotellaceae bacterium]|jgi:hypothetical protein|nr:DUF4465 domain-containing protein [Prevotellaceae bacterium]